MTRTDAHRLDMVQLARRVLQDNGFEPDPPPGIEDSIPWIDPIDGVRDLRRLGWSSVDNDDSRDLDQIEVAERLPGGSIRILVGIADVDAPVPKDSDVDRFARRNTVTLYTGVHTFGVLPEVLAFDRSDPPSRRFRSASLTSAPIECSNDQAQVFANKTPRVPADPGGWPQHVPRQLRCVPTVAAPKRLRGLATRLPRRERHGAHSRPLLSRSR